MVEWDKQNQPELVDRYPKQWMEHFLSKKQKVIKARGKQVERQLTRELDPKDDRINIVMSGKFLLYKMY